MASLFGYTNPDIINRYQKEIKHEYYQAWPPASAGMTDRDLAWSQFRRNYDPITLKLVGVLNHWHAILCYIFFFVSNSFPNSNADNGRLSVVLVVYNVHNPSIISKFQDFLPKL